MKRTVAQIATDADDRLSETDIIRLTDETARCLLDEADLRTELDIWVRRGRVIRDYVRRLQPRGRHKKPDPYVLLSGHTDIRWSPTQLRAFVDALELWEQVGEGAPSLPMTFYAVAASSGADFATKKAMLTKVVREHLSTRQLKKELARPAPGEDEPAGQQSPGATGDWKKVGAFAQRLAIEIDALDPEAMVDMSVVKPLTDAKERIEKLLGKLNAPNA
jgi:hypothetical protein